MSELTNPEKNCMYWMLLLVTLGILIIFLGAYSYFSSYTEFVLIILLCIFVAGGLVNELITEILKKEAKK